MLSKGILLSKACIKPSVMINLMISALDAGKIWVQDPRSPCCVLEREIFLALCLSPLTSINSC